MVWMVMNFRAVWDLRAFRKPLAARMDTPTLYPNTNAVFSPDDKYVITGASATAKNGHGKLLFLQKNDLEVVKMLQVGATPVKVVWHSKINQVGHVIPFLPSLTVFRLQQASPTAKYVCCTRQKHRSTVPSCCSTKGRPGKSLWKTCRMQ